MGIYVRLPESDSEWIQKATGFEIHESGVLLINDETGACCAAFSPEEWLSVKILDRDPDPVPTCSYVIRH